MEIYKKKNVTEKEYIYSATVTLNPSENGGEAVVLNVDFYNNGDKKDNIYCIYSFILNSYGKEAIIRCNMNLDVLERAVQDIKNLLMCLTNNPEHS